MPTATNIEMPRSVLDNETAGALVASLTGSELKVMLSLLCGKAMTKSEIGKVAGMSYKTVDAALDTLMHQGRVRSYQERRETFFAAVVTHSP